ncbi:hypothetical protein SporoP37_06580 [Sporosarcina sp. P37]|uniref:hypothetical protein n=1 Tax=unclassified Sporosarcina TaxID=2647733 RepID=UPI000A17BE66|nr:MULTISPECIES: hypothetical protein [unclassified Sporosarcina]ARK24365.1 hypothetical protein SporoP37_06580 [Sporosarcina sp. P37]PID17444.1 hypothetical protein CSV62_13345 [Sporosarcina sp. P35]
MLIYAIVFIVFFSFYILQKLHGIERRLARQQSMLEQLTEGLPGPAVDDDSIRLLIIQGETVKAVKRAREVFGFSLLEAKQYVDQLQEEIGPRQ